MHDSQAPGNDATPAEGVVRYVRVIFLDSDEGREVVDKLANVEDGYIVHGATEESITEAIAYLSQWDDHDDRETWERPSHGTADDTTEVGDYLLSWNTGLGYVGLERKVAL